MLRQAEATGGQEGGAETQGVGPAREDWRRQRRRMEAAEAKHTPRTVEKRRHWVTFRRLLALFGLAQHSRIRRSLTSSVMNSKTRSVSRRICADRCSSKIALSPGRLLATLYSRSGSA